MRASISLTLLFLAAAATVLAGVAHAEDVEDTIVFIECAKEGKRVSAGTGVVVSPKGHVLTAKHVVAEGSTCRGSLGVADPGAGRRMVVQPTSVPVDAALLRFSEQQDYAFMAFCPLEDWMIRRKIFVAGFPGTTQTGAASFREGVLATVLPNENGLLETDGQTIAGMSGGPVFSQNLEGLVGIVIGAETDASGNISYYGILPAFFYANDFGLIASSTPCYRQSREVDFANRPNQWKSGDGPVRLGVRAEDGICFLASVWGQFNDARDTVAVDLQDGEYVLKGADRSGGQLGASARCLWNE